MTRYTLHVPEQYNDGTPVGPDAFAAIEERLLALTGGYTLTHGIGGWQDPETGTIYREPVRLYAADTARDLTEQLSDLADLVASVLKQEAVYLTSAEIGARLVYPSQTPASVIH